MPPELHPPPVNVPLSVALAAVAGGYIVLSFARWVFDEWRERRRERRR